MDSKTIEKSLEQHINTQSSATVISAMVDDPTGYGRIVREMCIRDRSRSSL